MLAPLPPLSALAPLAVALPPTPFRPLRTMDRAPTPRPSTPVGRPRGRSTSRSRSSRSRRSGSSRGRARAAVYAPTLPPVASALPQEAAIAAAATVTTEDISLAPATPRTGITPPPPTPAASAVSLLIPTDSPTPAPLAGGAYTPKEAYAPHLPHSHVHPHSLALAHPGKEEDDDEVLTVLDQLSQAVAAEKHRQGGTLAVRVWRMFFSRGRF